MSQICILNYHDQYNIVISPMADTMSLQLADLNIYSTDPSFDSLCNEAFQANRSTINILGVNFPTSRCNPSLPKILHHIVFLNRQKSVYDLVFKLVKNPTERVTLIVKILKISNLYYFKVDFK